MDINKLWTEQYQLQQLWHDWTALSESGRDALIKELLLELHEQVNGLQRVMDQSKYHLLKQRRDHSEATTADAGVGVMKLLVALMLVHGVNADLFMKTWGEVTTRVKNKWRWEQDVLSETDVLLCDVDGVIALYTEGFKAWCLGRGYLSTNNLQDLERIKDEFHANGGFRSLGVIPGSITSLNRWRHSGGQKRLVMVTARPYKQYKQVYGDTVDWLQSTGLLYDHILFERDKAEAVRLVHPAKILGHIEDRGKHALEIANCGVQVYKVPFAAPEEMITHPLIRHVSGWDELDLILNG